MSGGGGLREREREVLPLACSQEQWGKSAPSLTQPRKSPPAEDTPPTHTQL